MAEAKKAKPKAAAVAKPEAKSKSKAEDAPKPKAAPKAKAKDQSKAGEGSQKPARASSSKSHSSPDIYTDPELRDRLKDEVMAGDKGGKPGQWSARKAQLLAGEYEKAGGDYKNGKQRKTDAQKHLDSWTDEDWKTSDDKPADREGGTTRYLPAEAWEKLTPAQRQATNAKKQAGSKDGEQFVANTDDAKSARKAATKSPARSKSASKAKPREQPEAKVKDQPKPKAKSRSKATPKSSENPSD